MKLNLVPVILVSLTSLVAASKFAFADPNGVAGNVEVRDQCMALSKDLLDQAKELKSELETVQKRTKERLSQLYGNFLDRHVEDIQNKFVEFKSREKEIEDKYLQFGRQAAVSEVNQDFIKTLVEGLKAEKLRKFDLIKNRANDHGLELKAKFENNLNTTLVSIEVYFRSEPRDSDFAIHRLYALIDGAPENNGKRGIKYIFDNGSEEKTGKKFTALSPDADDPRYQETKGSVVQDLQRRATQYAQEEANLLHLMEKLAVMKKQFQILNCGFKKLVTPRDAAAIADDYMSIFEGI